MCASKLVGKFVTHSCEKVSPYEKSKPRKTLYRYLMYLRRRYFICSGNKRAVSWQVKVAGRRDRLITPRAEKSEIPKFSMMNDDGPGKKTNSQIQFSQKKFNQYRDALLLFWCWAVVNALLFILTSCTLIKLMFTLTPVFHCWKSFLV